MEADVVELAPPVAEAGSPRSADAADRALHAAGWLGGVLLVAGLALPWAGWQGLRTVGLGVAAIGLLGVFAAATGLWRQGSWLALACGAAGFVLIAWRLASPPGLGLFHVAQSRFALVLGATGAAVIAGGGGLALWRGHRHGAVVARGWLDAERSEAVRDSWRAMWSSRMLVWAFGILGFLKLGLYPGVHAGVARPFGSLGNMLISPASAWDSSSYLVISQVGYAPAYWLRAFFPVYPAIVRAGAWSQQATVIVAILVSLAAFLAALYLLHRLVTLERGRQMASLTVLFVAFSPAALFFSGIYTESLFLALSVAAFYAARRDWWLRAGLLGGLAAATRSTGVVLLLPLLVLYLYGPRGGPGGPGAPRAPRASGARGWRPRHRARPDLGYLLLVPFGLFAVLAYSGAHGDWLMPLHAEALHWGKVTGFLAGATRGITAAIQSIHQIAAGPGVHVLPVPSFGEFAHPLSLAAVDLTDFAFFVFAVVASIGALRRLPAAYGIYALASIGVTVSTYIPDEPLVSIPRYMVVLFPIQIWLAGWARTPARRNAVLIVSAGLLAYFSSQFASWRWVA